MLLSAKFPFGIIKVVSNFDTLIICCSEDSLSCKPLHYTIQIICSMAGGLYMFVLCAFWIPEVYTLRWETEDYIIVIVNLLLTIDITSLAISNILSYVLICSSGPSSPPPTTPNYARQTTLNDIHSSPRVSYPSFQVVCGRSTHLSSARPYNAVIQN